MESTPEARHHRVVIVGGGSAGISVAARLKKADRSLDVAIIEPSETHYYQPIWTLVGGGDFNREDSKQPQSEVIPAGVAWIKAGMASIEASANTVITTTGDRISYDVVVLALGIQIDWNVIPGLSESVGKPGSGVCSNYSYETVNSTWDAIRNFTGGTAIFTQPGTPIKCGGAPQKIMYLADDAFRKQGVRDRAEIKFCTAAPSIFAVKKYADGLMKVIDRKGIEPLWTHNLVAIDPDNKVATFQHDGQDVAIPYDLLHVTPPMSAPDVLKASGLGNEGGWVNVDKHTTQHLNHPNVFSLGDCSSLPTSKTGAAIRAQAPVTAANVMHHLHGESLSAFYDGYTSCPLVTGYGSLILAEFDYDLAPKETFPFDQGKERWSMYMLKKHLLPPMYWHGMLRARA